MFFDNHFKNLIDGVYERNAYFVDTVEECFFASNGGRPWSGTVRQKEIIHSSFMVSITIND